MTERVRAEDLFFAIKRIGLDWTARMEMRFPGENITGIQVYFLVYILRHHPQGTYITEVCREIGVAKSTLSELVRKLKDKGYLAFEKNPEDIRRKRIIPTQKLLIRKSQLLETADRTEAEIFSVLDYQEQIQMYRMEKKILAQLTRMEDSEKKRQEVYLP